MFRSFPTVHLIFCYLGLNSNELKMEEKNSVKAALNEKLVELGFDIMDEEPNISRLKLCGVYSREITVQLIVSEPIDELIHGSQNENEIQAIGYFRFVIPSEGKEPDFYILAFLNPSGNLVEFVIIPGAELKKRLINRELISVDNPEIEIVFWLMPDSCLYETTNVGAEGEWYYMSKGFNGRMADGTDWDYTEFLNHWDRLTMT